MGIEKRIVELVCEILDATVIEDGEVFEETPAYSEPGLKRVVLDVTYRKVVLPKKDPNQLSLT